MMKRENTNMAVGKYFYQVKFKDGRVIRREYMSKKSAAAMGEAMSLEMILFNVQSVTWGVMQ